ncbi:hypothetical protein B566_EDAN015271 [Ephemera danica]|nr:hypothetical protein B566_EDAN015271 [Ephemera danica]
MHDALQSKDCTQVCQLLEKGTSLCTEEQDNCFTHILKNWRWHPFIVTALQHEPSALNCRGPEGDSLLIMCDSVEEMKTLIQFGPDLDARNNAGDHNLHNAVRNRIIQAFHKIMAVTHLLDFDDDIDSRQADFQGRFEVIQILESSKMLLEMICKCGVESIPWIPVARQPYKLFWSISSAGTDSSSIIWIKPTLPPADDFGRTALMKAALSPWNVDNMKILIQLGEEVRAKDHNGYNTIFYLLSSMTAKLLDLGCELQGTDILIIFDDSSFKVDSSYKVVVFLMALRDSELNLRTFPQKLLLKNDPRYLSFLNVLLQNRTFFFGDEEVDEFDPEKDWDESDISVISEEISAGIKTNQILEPFEGSIEEQEWRKKLKVPGAIQILLLDMKNTSRFIVDLEDPEVDYVPVLAGILRLLLLFWPSPPLALILAIECDVTSEFIDVSLCRRLLEVLHDVGGPLPLGSTLFVAMEEKLERMSPVCSTSVVLRSDPTSTRRRQTQMASI